MGGNGGRASLPIQRHHFVSLLRVDQIGIVVAMTRMAARAHHRKAVSEVNTRQTHVNIRLVFADCDEVVATLSKTHHSVVVRIAHTG
jgi:hypothetical protein